MACMRAVPALLAAGALLVAGGARAATWSPVPGAPDVEIDTGTLQQQQERVSAWLRWWGRPALVPGLAAFGARGPRVQRTVVRMEFDCVQRTVRVLAAHAYASDGAPVFMSSVPGPQQAVNGSELAWTYDAVCEAARSGTRL